MKNAKLAELNFRTLLHYNNVPDRGARSSFPIACSGFCVSCEKKGFLDTRDLRLDQMSHGADTEDMEKSICELPSGGLEVSVAFLLESPGGYYDLGFPIEHKGVTKRPPVKQYYWTPSPRTSWPKNPNEVDNMYGPYFAYIIATHELRNAYFTNIIKCSLAKRDADQFVGYYVVRDPDIRDSNIRTNCYDLFLSEEIRIVKPEIVFYFDFGQKAEKMGDYAGLRCLLPAAQFVRLYHPAARYRNPNDIISHNDKCIRAALEKRKETQLTNIQPRTTTACIAEPNPPAS